MQPGMAMSMEPIVFLIPLDECLVVVFVILSSIRVSQDEVE